MPQLGAVDKSHTHGPVVSSVVDMRWDNLFDDLEGQLEQELSAEEVDLRAEEERLRLGRIALRDRLIALAPVGRRADLHPIRITLIGGRAVAVRPSAFGRDWLSGDLVDDSARRSQCILPLAAIGALEFSRRQVEESLVQVRSEGEERGLAARLGLGFVLRDLCRRRRSVELDLGTGVVHGTIDRVARDHLDLAVHESGTPRRESAVIHYRVVPFAELRLVRL